jgi:hypothetical protein
MLKFKGIIKETGEKVEILAINYETNMIFIKDNRGLCDEYEIELVNLNEALPVYDIRGRQLYNNDKIKITHPKGSKETTTVKFREQYCDYVIECLPLRLSKANIKKFKVEIVEE